MTKSIVSPLHTEVKPTDNPPEWPKISFTPGYFHDLHSIRRLLLSDAKWYEARPGSVEAATSEFRFSKYDRIVLGKPSIGGFGQDIGGLALTWLTSRGARILASADGISAVECANDSADDNASGKPQ